MSLDSNNNEIQIDTQPTPTMGSNIDFISLSDAKHFVGVSEKTLSRFTEAGYLKVNIEDGQSFFSKSNLAKVFNIPLFNDNISTPLYIPTTSTTNIAIANSTYEETKEAAAIADIITTPPILENSINTKDQEQSSIDITSYDITSHDITNPEIKSPESVAKKNSTDEKSKESLTILKAINELNEKLLDAKDKEISDLKSQRDWLQKRVEQMEEKANRDQILLMTETQVLSKILLSQNQKRNPLQATLSWLGFNSKNENSK